MAEAALGLSILLVVALASAPSSSRPAPSTPTAASTPLTKTGIWNAHAVPIVTSLADDLRAIMRDTADPTQAEPAWLGFDDARLRTDLDAAQRLQPSPDPIVRTAWTETLGRLLRSDRTLEAAASNLDPATVELTHQQFTVAGDGLVRIGQVISPGG